MRVLLVEDDRKLGELIRDGLVLSGHAVTYVETGKLGYEEALRGSYDVAIFDVMLPELDGLSAIEKLRRSDKSLPVLILSAKRKVTDRVEGLRMGGDDYMTKPFAFVELLARLEVLTRRAKGMSSPIKLNLCGLTLNTLTRTVEFASRTVELQPREFDLLRYLVQNVGQTVSRTMIIEEVWNYNFNPRTNIVEVVVKRLREKLERLTGRKFIQTIRGVGYRFREDS